MDAEKRERLEQALIRSSNVRQHEKRNFKSARRAGEDFIGLEERVKELKQEHERWKVLSQHCFEISRTNIVIAEFIFTTRMVAENTFALMRTGVKLPKLESLLRSTERVILFVSDIWMYGVDPTEPVNRKIDNLSWVTLQSVIAVGEYHLALQPHLPSKTMIEREAVPGSLYKRPISSWFLADFMNALDTLAAAWCLLDLDAHTAEYVNALRRQYCKLATNGFGTRAGVLNYGTVKSVETVYGPADFIGTETDMRVCAVFREMYKDIFRRDRLIGQFRAIHIPKPLPESAEAAIAMWMGLTSVTCSGNASNIVLKRFRLWFFYFFFRPGQSERYNNENAHRVGEEFRSRKVPTFESLTQQRELEFNALFPSEAGAFSNKFFDANAESIVNYRFDGAFGARAYMLVFLLGFAHTFSMHLVHQWMEMYFLDEPLPHILSERDGRNYILLVRFKGEFFVVHTQTMDAFRCADIFHAVYIWLHDYAVQPDNTPIMYAIASDLFEQMFVKGTYEMSSLRKKEDVYAGNTMIAEKIAALIVNDFEE